MHVEDPGIAQQVLAQDRLVAVLPSGHPLAGQPLHLAQLASAAFVLYPAQPRPSYADHVLGLFAAQGVALQVSQWANEMQTAIGLVAAGLGVTLVPATVQQQHRTDVDYAPVLDAHAVSPIILSARASDVSPLVRHCIDWLGQRGQ